MNPAAGGRARPNDDSELTRFKDQIPLVPLATSRYGYEVTDQARNGSWHKLEKPGEVLIVSQKEGRDVYMNAGDTKDSGSVVDFVKTRDGLNLGQVRQQLRQYLGEGGPEQDRQLLAQRPAPSRLRQAERGPEATLPDDPRERRDELLKRTLGIQPALTDRSYLRERGLSDETIDAPAFTGRVFTGRNGPHKNTVFPLFNEQGYSSYEERNHNFKSQMPGPRDGIWVSHPTRGRGTAVERIVVGESPIDAMSKYQLEQPGGTGPNTLYMSSSGTMSQRQVELMQKVIDRQQPQQVVLANDNDAAGVRFNLNYLNDFRAPRPIVALEAGAETSEQQRGQVTWRATRAGDYHTDLKVSFETERQREGRTAVAGLQQQVAGWQQQGGEPAASLEVLRLGSDQTVARLTVTNDQLPQLRGLVQQLHTQREAALPEAQRTPPGFFVWEAARSKDYNQDLTDQLTQQRLERTRERAGFDKASVAAPAMGPHGGREPAPGGAGLVSPIERPVSLEIVEQNPPRGGGAAGQMELDLQKAGLRITGQQQEVNLVSGVRTTRIEAHYLVMDPEATRRAISTQLEIIGRVPGVTLLEAEAHARERRELAHPPALKPLELPEQQLAESKSQFSAAARELGTHLGQQGIALHAARLTELSRHVLERDILPLRGLDRENLDGALAMAGKLPALQEKGLPGPLVLAVQQAEKSLDEKFQTVQELGGVGGQRARLIVVDEKASGENRAVQLWKDLKAEGAGVGNLVQREAAPGLMERTLNFRYDPTPGATVAGVESVLKAAERSPGIMVEEPARARQVRQQAADIYHREQQTAGREVNLQRGPYPSRSPEWVTYAVTSPAPPASAELKEQTEALKKAGAIVVPLAGQGQGEQTQLVSFHLKDPRLGAISEAARQMSEKGGIRFDLERRVAVGETGGWAAGLVRLTEAQDAATRTPQILDDLRANGVLIQDSRRAEAPRGFVREEVRLAYQLEQNPVGVAAVLDALKRSPGVEVVEEARQQQAREQLAATERERQADVRRQQAGQEQQRPQAERERPDTTPEAQRAREQQDRLLRNAMLAAAGREPLPPAGGPQKAPAFDQATDQQRTPATDHPYRYAEVHMAAGGQNEDKLRLRRGDFELAGASVTAMELQRDLAGRDQLRVMVGYRIDQPELPQIQEQLKAAQQSDTVLYKERGGQGMERSRELERRQREPAVGLSFPLETGPSRDPARKPAFAGQQGTGQLEAGPAQPTRDYYPAEGWKTQVLRGRRDDELAPVVPQLISVGAQVGGTLPDGAGGREMVVSFHPAAVKQDKVLEVMETYRAAREVGGPVVAPVAPAPAKGTERAPERAVQAAPAVLQPTLTTTTTMGREQPFRTVGVRVVEEGSLPGRAEQWREELQKQGAIVGDVQKKAAGEELHRFSFTASYPLGPQSAGIARTLEAAGRQPGISLEEPLGQQRERQRLFGGEVPAISATALAPASGYAPGLPPGAGQWQQGVVLVRDTDEERARTANVRDALLKAGAQLGAGGERNDGIPGGAIRYSYNTRQDNLEMVNKILDSAAQKEGIEVREQKPQQPGPELEPREGKFNQAIISIEDTPEKGKARAKNIGGELSKGGAVVGEVKVVGNHVEMPVSYYTKTPNIQHINDTLDRAANSSGIQVKENGEDRGARRQGAREVARESAGASSSMERERS